MQLNPPINSTKHLTSNFTNSLQSLSDTEAKELLSNSFCEASITLMPKLEKDVKTIIKYHCFYNFFTLRNSRHVSLKNHSEGQMSGTQHYFVSLNLHSSKNPFT